MIGDLCWSTELLYVFFSLNVSNGLVRTMGNVLRSTRRTVTCAFARKDTQGNIVKRVKHNLVYIYTETASNLTEGVILWEWLKHNLVYNYKTASNLTDGLILFHYRRMTQSFAVYRFLVLIEYFQILTLIHSQVYSV